MDAQLKEYAKNCWAVYFKWAKFVAYELHFNHTI